LLYLSQEKLVVLDEKRKQVWLRLRDCFQVFRIDDRCQTRHLNNNLMQRHPAIYSLNCAISWPTHKDCSDLRIASGCACKYWMNGDAFSHSEISSSRRRRSAARHFASSREQTAKQKIISTFLRSNSKIQWACEIPKYGHNKTSERLLHEILGYPIFIE
jgi:hypothetical protein